MKFRKKPVIIDAVQFTGDNTEEIMTFVPKPWYQGFCYLSSGNKESVKPTSKMGFKLKTLESQIFIAQDGDWIIKGVNGEFYACKPDIFDKTYEKV